MPKDLALPPLPDSIHDTVGKPKTAAFASLIIQLWNDANDVVQKFNVVRTAATEGKSQLAESDHPAAVAYRTMKAEADSKRASVKQELRVKYNLDAYDQELAERTTQVGTLVREAEQEALTAVVGAIVDSASPEELSAELNAKNVALGPAIKLISDENPELAGYRLITVKQARGGKSPSSTGLGAELGEGSRPRFAAISVNDVPVVPKPDKKDPTKETFPTFTDVYHLHKSLNPKILRDHLADALGGGSIPTDQDTTFVHGDFKITVRGR